MTDRELIAEISNRIHTGNFQKEAFDMLLFIQPIYGDLDRKKPRYDWDSVMEEASSFLSNVTGRKIWLSIEEN
jgi:hypothetical protein